MFFDLKRLIEPALHLHESGEIYCANKHIGHWRKFQTTTLSGSRQPAVSGLDGRANEA
jgi:hypothetical protein